MFQFCQVQSGSCQVGFIGAIPGETYVHAFVSGVSPVQTTTEISVSPGSGSNTLNNGLGQQTFEGAPLDFSSGMPCLTPSACGSINFTPPVGDAGDQFATTFRLLDGTDSGVGSSNLGNTQYGDISITATSGSSSSNTLVNVCLPDTSADSKTILEYWDSTTSTWVTASNIVVTSGVKVCGDIPLSVINGRNIVGGDPVSLSGQTLVQGNVAVYTTYKGPFILLTANATISSLHSLQFLEEVFPQYGYLPNGTWGYIGYYQGTFGAVAGGGISGMKVDITVLYNGQSITNGTTVGPAGETTVVDFTFGTPSQNTSASFTILAAFLVPMLGGVEVYRSTWMNRRNDANMKLAAAK